ncbi:hypothetical protein [Rhizobium chutanense]|uniref:hypothetical protein n=1 Tax=Rhizobium chutanense TaxID=2035448 RepID=UPI0013DF8EEE|nr:hypothetical protein [Rhizobium chutanense]
MDNLPIDFAGLALELFRADEAEVLVACCLAAGVNHYMNRHMYYQHHQMYY